MGDTWEYVTPETKKFRKRKDGETTAIRAKWFQDQVQQQKKCKTSTVSSSRWSLKSFLLLTPWSSVVSWAFLVSGAVVYTLNASKTSTKTQLLLDAIESSENPYNANLEKIISSTTISSILVIVSILVGVVASWIHIKGVLGGHLWGSSTRLIFISLLTIGLLYLVGCFSWFFITMNYISSWCTGLWTLEISTANVAAAAKRGEIETIQTCSFTCLNLQNYPFLNTDACICEYQGLIKINELASSTKLKAVWLLVGIACCVFGLLVSIINLSADIGCIYTTKQQESTKYAVEKESIREEHGETQKTTFKLPSMTPGSIKTRARIPT